METPRFDQIARLFADRRPSRRARWPAEGRVASAPAAAMSAVAAPGEKVEHLFDQSFQSGSVAPKAGAARAFTLTLEQGFGQTVYFSNRPERVVGTAPTAQFLGGDRSGRGGRGHGSGPGSPGSDTVAQRGWERKRS